MTPDWLKLIEARLKAQDAGEQLFSPACQNLQLEQLVSALKLAIEELDLIIQVAADASDCSTDIPGEEYQSEEFRGAFIKAREILEKIKRGEG